MNHLIRFTINLDDLVAVTQPRSMKIVAEFTPRGGIRTNVIAEYVAESA